MFPSTTVSALAYLFRFARPLLRGAGRVPVGCKSAVAQAWVPDLRHGRLHRGGIEKPLPQRRGHRVIRSNRSTTLRLPECSSQSTLRWPDQLTD